MKPGFGVRRHTIVFFKTGGNQFFLGSRAIMVMTMRVGSLAIRHNMNGMPSVMGVGVGGR